MMERIRLFHATSDEAAAAILAKGFRDSANDRYPVQGVFLSAFPLTLNEGTKGDAVLEVVIESTPERMFYDWELSEADKPWREWIIPAVIVNQGSIRLLTADEVDSVEDFWNGYPPGEPQKTYAELDEDPIGE